MEANANASGFILPAEYNISNANLTGLNLTEYAMPDSLLSSDYVAPKFNNTHAIKSLHLDTSRGNNTNNISVMFLWSPEVASGTIEPIADLQKSYIVGVCISPILVIGLGILWSFVLVVLRMLGWRFKCLGCAAGKAFYYPLPPKSLEGKEIQPVLNGSFGLKPSILGDMTDFMDDMREDLKKDIKKGRNNVHRGFTPNFDARSDEDEKRESSTLHSNKAETLRSVEHAQNYGEKENFFCCEKVVQDGALGYGSKAENMSAMKKQKSWDGASEAEWSSSVEHLTCDENNQSRKGSVDSPEEKVDEPVEKDYDEALLEEERLSVGIRVKALVDELFWRARVERAQKRIQRTRVAFIYSGLISVATCILFLVFAVRYISSSVKDIQRALTLTESATIRAINITETFIDSANRTNDAIINAYGPKMQGFCNGTENATTIEYDQETQDFLRQIEDTAKNVTSNVFDFNIYIMEQLTLLLGDLEFALEAIRKIQHYTTFSYWGFVFATVFICLLVFFVVVLMAGAFSAFLQEQRVFWQCARSYILLPIMFIMLAIAWIFCTLFLVIGILLADFCFNSPDNNMYLILNNFRRQLGNFLYRLLLQYISGCTVGLGDEFDQLYRLIVSVLYALIVLVNQIRDMRADSISELCGVEKDFILNTSGLLLSALKQYFELFIGLGAIFNCSVWSPIYTSVTHDALCYNGTSGVLWGFVTIFVVCISGLIMVCLRSAWQKVKNAEVVEKSPELLKKQKDIRHRVERFWLRFGPFFRSIGRVPRSIVLFFETGVFRSCCNRCTSKTKIKVNEGSADGEQQEPVGGS